MEEGKYGHLYDSICTGFGADPKCTHCGRTMSHVFEAGVFECEERKKYMKVMKSIEKELKEKKEKEPAITFADMVKD
jgi:predicted Fe-S protein YdhL (DUF1289 family)